MTSINYESLVQEYNESLINVLRGFRPKYDFLELWVPDANHNKSILNLAESAQSFGVPQITLELQKDTLKSLDINELNKDIGTIGKLSLDESSNIAKIIISNLCEQVESNFSTGTTSALDVPEIYQSSIKDLLSDIQHESSVQDDDELVLIRSNHEGTSLFFAMDKSSHMIRRAVFAGAANDIEKALLEGLCRLIEGTPIQDASDHGILRLEDKLRDHSQKQNVPGILNVFNLHPIFKVTQKLIRLLYKKYNEDFGPIDDKNFWDGSVSSDWRLASIEQRLNKVQFGIDNFAKSNNLSDGLTLKATNIDKGVKVSIVVDGEITPFEKAALLLNLEVYLKTHVEDKIEVYQEMWKDKNQKRRI